MKPLQARLTPCIALALAWPTLGNAAAPSVPPPGEYRIDSEATIRTGNGAAAVERTERVDGATGNRVITSRAGPAGNPGSRQTLPGTGPVTWCVKRPAAAPADLPGRCSARWWPKEGAATLQADCQAGRMQEQWKQLDARTWERQLSFTMAANAANNDPSAALALVQRGMSPAEAAQARTRLAALPGAQATTTAMAPVIAQMEETIRTGSPQEAAAAREQLAALKAAQGGGGAAASTTRLTERWTRMADSCVAGS